MAKSQLDVNNEIEQFIERKEANNEVYTYEELHYLQRYTGSGGLKSTGERGILYEYYTPEEVIQKMWGLAFHHGFTSGRILEPSCGTGRFLRYINPELNTVDAYEFSKDNDTGYKIAKACFPFATIVNNYFESIFYEKKRRLGTNEMQGYELVIGNPPYGNFSGYYAAKQLEGKYFPGSTYDQYFLWAGIELLNYKGLLVFIIPSTFLMNSNKYNNLKAKIADKATLLDAYRLPKGIFQQTDLQTDIVVFQKTV